MSRVFHRHLKASYPTAVAGDGPYLIDAAGKRYLDACGGAAVSCLGHSDPEVQAAISEQVKRMAYAHSSFFTSEPMEALADFLVDRAPQGIGSVYFVSGGSEAVEAALKMARQYFLEIGQPERTQVIARRQSYHGNTLGALATGGNAWRRRPFEPLLADTTHVSPCYAYRGQRADESAEAYGERLAVELEDTIERLGPRRVMAFVAEPVVGATLGAVPAVPGYFRRVREICDRHGILLILDEVMCGMGRTGSLFACEQEGVSPDLLTVAKGLGGGYQPIGATLASARIRDTIAEGTGFFQHGHTYIGHATACAAALAVQRAVEKRGLLEQVRARGEALRARLEQRFGDHPHVGDIRGRGLFLGLELVADRASKEPFDPDRRLNAAVKAAAMDQGLMCYPAGGTLDGRRGDHVLLAPPYIVEEDHLDEIVDKLDAALQQALGQVGH
ncbi:aspartate aminotransferase family protein [Halomonas litopenaei]|uniref:Aspartate aminotransferase family protein n=1 Tax=Halomonas litopenaei TaxID=2109328 RepID=A0ABX5IVM6_9GAMM|nr:MULTISPECIES: aspartate aminotransferase family protein [Halomonas]PTL90890.1 aspartate aminotransferase family protein [Halomonas sp. SYSU XM8]PTL93520.1 aspartate aminotransferase family protein [Halomonas litopenaei]